MGIERVTYGYMQCMNEQISNCTTSRPECLSKLFRRLYRH